MKLKASLVAAFSLVSSFSAYAQTWATELPRSQMQKKLFQLEY
jgi:hypothetical protein